MKIQRIATHVLRLMFFTALSAVIQVQAAQAQAPQGKPVTIRERSPQSKSKRLK